MSRFPDLAALKKLVAASALGKKRKSVRLGVPQFSPITSTGPALHSVAENMARETCRKGRGRASQGGNCWDRLKCPKSDRKKQGWDLDLE